MCVNTCFPQSHKYISGTNECNVVFWHENLHVHGLNKVETGSLSYCQLCCLRRLLLTPALARGCVIAAAMGWRLWGTQQRRCLLSSWPRSSSCWGLLSVEGDGNETPCINHSHFRCTAADWQSDNQGKYSCQISVLSHSSGKDDKYSVVKRSWGHNLLHFSVFHKDTRKISFFFNYNIYQQKQYDNTSGNLNGQIINWLIYDGKLIKL